MDTEEIERTIKENIKNYQNLKIMGGRIMEEYKLELIETKLDAIVSQNTAILNSINRLNLFMTQNIESMKQFSDSIIMHIQLVKEIGNKMGEISEQNNQIVEILQKVKDKI